MAHMHTDLITTTDRIGMIASNVDGDFTVTLDDLAGVCKHGVYVGGCGWDLMCGACEMGDPDETPRQARQYADRKVADFWELYDMLVASAGVTAANHTFDELTRNGFFSSLMLAIGEVEWIGAIANGPDDDDYLARMRAGAIAEARADHETA